MRQIILDTETTGIGPEQGHRVIEIGCIELIDRKLTGNHFHVYLNPQREVDEGAFRVHGISTEFLQDKPLFQDIVTEFLQFVEGSELIIHNAPFDVGFLNSELNHVKWNKTLEDYCQILDTLVLAREKHPGQRNSLDALCKRYEIDHFNRELHGALLDAEILAYVYLAMTGGQSSLFTEVESSLNHSKIKTQEIKPLSLKNPVIMNANEAELIQHQSFIEFISKKSGINHWEEV
ncbi:TPA: DNA polymerase III subunit epsilon [Legionella pneumophila]|uniref:DNA polymerase III subunit epsilon n=1 Tax=Legionella pneumophila TaxID=446 RepID=UPI000D06B739|nr:DNA polymerase III subunit epsilon [Legionella pneumophila]MDW8880185.1 DNA polymerase III subunit epsilon [Legionella pneumophila subsp. fraseri]MDW8963157.1 DNA polymerase III subunit epsilon [Legionella pneumophila subsp. fraseri]MDW9036890.1 DNA polymerase III subunit epsilon [Legionella pneumophila subsp. fraseri]MDW9040094.1 DNA polymerase III subunit epsilon [Legionella pneumophila subsp. fraseri]MDW9043084.1 DNA polymerase III subunit epsilon [Legionella pneumophila subsp. fraseri]